MLNHNRRDNAMKLPALVFGVVIGLLTVGFVSMPSDQATQKKGAQKAQSQGVKIVYACPMHPEVTSGKRGKCTECGMALAKKAAKSAKQAGGKYLCPMHPEVTSDKPGECPKCGMDLKK
jgi:predicted RNA-binding Zn-ribbon protein involved in translation (DUF1610 family)